MNFRPMKHSRWGVIFLCAIVWASGYLLREQVVPGDLVSAHGGKGVSSSDAIWSFTEGATRISTSLDEAESRPVSQTVVLNPIALGQVLSLAPMEFTDAARTQSVVVSLPMPDGSFSRFRVEESPIMEPELAAKFPELKTYRGQGIDDPTATTRFDWTPQGLHAILLSATGTVFVRPVVRGEPLVYMTYDSHHDFEGGGTRHCSVGTPDDPVNRTSTKALHNRIQAVPMQFSSGTQLRTYRLAVGVTAEFTQQYGGGTVAGGMNAIVSSTNLITAIFQRETAIRFVLVARQNELVFTDTNTDGYTNGNNNSLLTENQAKLDQVIGSANYDIGHVYATISSPFSGVAELGSVCQSQTKGTGASSIGLDPSGPTVVGGVAHEYAHQFSAPHSYNGTTAGCSQREATTAWEPGSGTTIMSYSGICDGENLANDSDNYFHVGSLGNIFTYSTSASDCSAKTPTGNNPPVIGSLSNAAIPARTPFTLTASATDQDGDALTYCWEQFDLGQQGPPNNDNGNRPIFRSYPPTASSSRTFPSLKYILENNGEPPTTINVNGQTFLSGEALVTTTRVMNFRVTVRDNKAAGGGTASAGLQVSVQGDRGPFTVTSPTAGASWTPGSQQQVTWNVANTNTAPINTANVRITLSTDGGTTFSTVLAASVPNNGSATVTAPGNVVANARVRVEAIGNIFFNLSPAFSVRSGCQPITVGPATLPVAAAFTDYTAQLTASGGTQPITFRVSQGNLPENVALSPNGQITGTPQTTGQASFTVTATDSTGCTQTRAYTLDVQAGANAGDTGGTIEGGRQAGEEIFEFPVTLTAPSSQPVEIEYQTEDGTAVAGVNYEPVSGKLIFPPGTTEQVIQVKVMEATEGGEAEDEFFVVLGDAVNAVIEDGRGEGSIFEDDLASCPTITVGPSTLPNAKADVSYTQRFSGAGGDQIETFSLSGGSLPSGLALNQTTGVLSGVPVAAGGFSFEVTVADATGCLGTRQFTLTVDPAAPKISSFSPTSGRAGTSVVIVGARLTGVTQVRFADKPATTVTVNSSGQITAVVPPGATTGPILVMGPGGSTVSTVAFTILNSAPTATDATLSAKQNTPTTGKLTASDPEGTPLRFETVRSESAFRGIVTITNVTTGEYTYTPGRDFVGTESFFFRVFDGTAYSNLGRVTVTVAPDSSPRISSVEVSGKDLIVNGENFGQGAIVLVNGVAKTTTNDAQSPTRKLVAKKAGKKIKVGQTVAIQVRNPDGTTSTMFNFTRQ